MSTILQCIVLINQVVTTLEVFTLSPGILIQVSLVRQKDNAISNFKKQIAKIDEIVECYQVTGNYDYLLKVVVKDIPSFEKLIGEKLSKIADIGQMQTNVILSEVKKSHVLPLNYD